MFPSSCIIFPLFCINFKNRGNTPDYISFEVVSLIISPPSCIGRYCSYVLRQASCPLFFFPHRSAVSSSHWASPISSSNSFGRIKRPVLNEHSHGVVCLYASHKNTVLPFGHLVVLGAHSTYMYYSGFSPRAKATTLTKTWPLVDTSRRSKRVFIITMVNIRMRSFQH